MRSEMSGQAKAIQPTQIEHSCRARSFGERQAVGENHVRRGARLPNPAELRGRDAMLGG
jgi:hypothetical protein